MILYGILEQGYGFSHRYGFFQSYEEAENYIRNLSSKSTQYSIFTKHCISETGDYECCEPVLYPLQNNKLINVDKCLLPELQDLWLHRIETCGCCCGHGEEKAYIQVESEYIDKMIELDYKQLEEKLDCFKPKSFCNFELYAKEFLKEVLL